MFIMYNPNPHNDNVGDCVIRALTKVQRKTWDEIYLELMEVGFKLKNLPSANYVWGVYLVNNGFKRFAIPNSCPDCYTVKDFCVDYPIGTYVLATGSHVIAVENGNYYDSWDSGNEVIAYAYERLQK